MVTVPGLKNGIKNALMVIVEFLMCGNFVKLLSMVLLVINYFYAVCEAGWRQASFAICLVGSLMVRFKCNSFHFPKKSFRCTDHKMWTNRFDLNFNWERTTSVVLTG